MGVTAATTRSASAAIAASAAAAAAAASHTSGGRATTLVLAAAAATAGSGSSGRARRRPRGAWGDGRPSSQLQRLQQVRAFHVPMPWDGRRKAREQGELQLIDRVGAALTALDGPLTLAENSPFRALVEERGRGAGGEGPKKEEFQRWLGAAEAELGLLAKAQMGVFSGGEWWAQEAGHVDRANATQALHCLRLQQLCAELKKSKAVFTPHLPGDRLLPGAVRRVVALLCADMDGDLEGRLRAAWALQDYPDPTQQKPVTAEGYTSESALLSEQAMEEAVYTALNPTVATAAALYPSLGGVTKAQKKAFAKFIKFYTRDQADFPTKLRCIFHWAERPPEPQLATPPPVPPPKVISFEAYLATQKENFPDLHQVGAGVPQLYKRVREAKFHQKSEDRDTFRVGILYLIGLGFADVYISGL